MSHEQRWFLKLLAVAFLIGAILRWTGVPPPCIEKPALTGAGFFVTSNCKAELNAASQ